MLTMVVRYNRDIRLPHTANYTCGGVTGHSPDCLRSICRKITHDKCSHTDIHYTESIKD